MKKHKKAMPIRPQKMVKIKPLSPQLTAKMQNAMNAHAAGNNEQALMIAEEITKADPKHPDAYHLIGCILGSVKSYLAALQYFNLSIERLPTNPVALNNRANVFQALKQPELAIMDFNSAIKLDPTYAEAYYNKGIVLGTLHKIEEEIENYDLALKYKPNFPEAYNNKGIALQKLHRMEETLACYQAGIAQNPNGVEAFYNNRGLVYQNLGRPDEAIEDYNRAVAIDPNLADARFNRSLCLLLRGEYDIAWDEHEWRWMRPVYPKRNLPGILYDGTQDISGKTLFIHGEQGLGDMLQFCRYAKLAKKAGAKVVIGTEKSLVRLLTTLEGVDQVVSIGDAIPPYEYHIPLMSLPYAFKTRMDTIPHGIYLKSDPDLVEEFKGQFFSFGRKKNVGLVWSGGFRPDQPEVWAVNERRNIALSKLLPLKEANVNFYSLQKGEGPEQELANCLGWKHMINDTAHFKDFADTAAYIQNLDLVICVDTSTCHVAAAMGKEVWMMNRFDTCWRWFMDRTDSPWYPTIKLYRQPKLGDWESVVQNIKEDLIEWAK
jgi:tetratricopeptide (TPR) repeat protein